MHKYQLLVHRVFFYLTLICLPLQLGYHTWPSWSIVLGRRIDYLSPTLYITDLLVIGTILSWLTVYPSVLRYMFLNKGKSIVLLVGIGTYIFINILFAYSRQVAFLHWLRFAEFTLFSVYIYQTKPRLERVVLCLSVAILYSTLIGMLQFILQRSIGGPFWFLGERLFFQNTPGIAQASLYIMNGFIKINTGLVLRAYATFPHPNVFGGFIAILFPLVVYVFLKEKQKYVSAFLCLTLIASVLGLVITFSRSAIITAGFAAILVCVTKLQLFIRTNRIQLLAGLVLVLLLSSIILVMSQDLTPTSETLSIRQQLTVSSVKIWRQSPLIGVGLGNFLLELPEAVPSKTVYFLQPVHNIYLLVLSECGLIGLFSFIAILAIAIIYQINIMRSNSSPGASGYLLLSLGVMLTLGLADHYLLTLQQGQLLFFTVLSLLLMNHRHT